jgi:DNA-directed RNA polymerase subunit RPC12/RpoP
MKRGISKDFKFITELPIWIEGRYKGKTKYSEMIGENITVIYFGKEYSFNVLEYNKNKRELLCKYKTNLKPIKTYNFIEGKFGCLLQEFNRDSIYSLGDIVDNKLEIIDVFTKIRKIDNTNIKYYKYKCLKCGNIDEISQIDLVQGVRCNVCCLTSRKVVKEINSIWATNNELVKYFLNEEDSWKYTCGSHKSLLFKCPDCGFKYKRKIYDFIKTQRCPYCGDGKSFGEKIMCNILKQLKINFKMEKTFEWSKNIEVDNIELCGNKRYDFYLYDYNILIETHGKQHYYNQGANSFFKKSIEEEQENDRIKKELAIKNGIKEDNYIIINCEKSELEWIKNNILNSKLSELFDLSLTDWQQCLKYANGSLILQVAMSWNNSNKNTNDLAKEFMLTSKTIREYLHKSEENNLLTRRYDGKMEASKSKSINGKKQGKSIIVTLPNGKIKKYINFKTASDDLGISVDAIRNIIKRKTGFKSKNSINGYNESLDGLTIKLTI